MDIVRSETSHIRVLIVDDHVLVAETTAQALSTFPDIDVTVVTDIEAACDAIAKHGRFDVVMMDYYIPGSGGLDNLQRLTKDNSGKVVLFSGVARWALVDRAIELGAAGYIPKTTPVKALQHAIRMVADGETYLSIDYIRRSNRDKFDEYGLKSVEREVLEHLCDGLMNKEIARQLDLDEVTVKMHVRSIFRKLDVRNRTQAAIEAQRLGFLD